MNVNALRELYYGETSAAAGGAEDFETTYLQAAANAGVTAVQLLSNPKVISTALYCDMTGATDGSAGLRTAYAAAAAANVPLVISPGTILLSTVNGDGCFVTMTKGIPIYAQPGTATLKVASGTPSWLSVIGVPKNSTTDLTGLHIEGIIFDGNSSGNAVTPSDLALLISTRERYAISAYKGDHITVKNCRFVNSDNVNCVMIDLRVNGGKYVRVKDNTFTNIGGAGANTYHDHSTIYADGVYVEVSGNTIVGIPLSSFTPSATVSSSVICALEIHGSVLNVHDNVVENAEVGCNPCTAYATNLDGDSSMYHCNDNKFRNVSIGVNFVTLGTDGTPVSDVQICGNEISISPDMWTTSIAHAPPRCGIVLQPYALSPVSRLKVEDNHVSWLPHSSPDSNSDIFFRWIRAAGKPTVGDVDVSIRRNIVVNCPSSAVYIFRFQDCTRWDISDNEFYNVGRGGFAFPFNEAVVFSDGVALVDVSVNRNKVVDDQATHTLRNIVGVNTTLTVPTTTNVEVLDNTLSVADGTAIPLVTLPASRVAYVRGATPNWAAMGGSGTASAGSSITDTTTGLTRVQTATPSGTTWTVASHSGSAGYAALHTRTAGDVTANSIALADVDNTLDCTVTAATGDIVAVRINAQVGGGATDLRFAVATIVSAAVVHYVAGSSTAFAGGWIAPTGVTTAIGGQLLYAVQSGDVSAGTVTFRLRVSTAAAVNKVISATAGVPLQFSVVNYG